MLSTAVARRDGDGEAAAFSAALARRDCGDVVRRGCRPPGPAAALRRRRGVGALHLDRRVARRNGNGEAVARWR